jgi:hypothetical protein
MKKWSSDDIKRIISEEIHAIHEDVAKGVDSIDRQIDGYLLDYERDSAIPKKHESKTLRTALKYLFEEEASEDEAESEEESSEPSTEVDPDTASDEEIRKMIEKLKSSGYDVRLTVDDSSVAVDEPGEEVKQPLNTDSFSERVTRLIQNFNNLVDVESAIRNRTRQFMLDRYDKAAAEEVDEKLDKLNRQGGEFAEDPEAPLAPGAGGSKIA